MRLNIIFSEDELKEMICDKLQSDYRFRSMYVRPHMLKADDGYDFWSIDLDAKTPVIEEEVVNG